MNSSRSLVHRPPKARWWTTIVEYADNVSVPGALTTLLAFTDYGSDFEALAVFLNNQDATNPADLIVDVSHGGTDKIGELTQTKTCPADEEVCVILGAPHPFTNIRIGATSAFTVNVKWALLGLPR